MFNGKIRGAFYLYMLGTVFDYLGEDLTTKHFPRMKNFVKAAPDLKNQWYGWEGYTEFLEDVVKVTTDDDLMKIGIKAMQYLKEGYVSAGFDSADKVFRDYDPLMKKNTKQMPSGQLPKTIEYNPGHAVIDVNINQPIALMTGFFYGIAQMFGNTITALNYEIVSIGNFTVNRYTLTWK